MSAVFARHDDVVHNMQCSRPYRLCVYMFYDTIYLRFITTSDRETDAISDPTATLYYTLLYSGWAYIFMCQMAQIQFFLLESDRFSQLFLFRL